MRKYCFVLACCLAACACWGGPARADDLAAEYKAELLSVLEKTKSPDAFMVALKLLGTDDVDPRVVIPVAIRNAERLGIFGDFLLQEESPNRERAGDLEELLMRRANRIPAADPKLTAALPAKMKHLPSKDEKANPKVVILTYAGSADLPLELINAERQLTELVKQKLEEVAKGQEEKILVMPIRRVEEFKNANPDWKGMLLAAIGRRLGADYAVFLEVNSLSLYEGLSNQMLFRGRANINLQLAEVSKPDDTPRQETHSCVFPENGPVEVSLDLSPTQFRQQFLAHVGKQLARYFSNYPRAKNSELEPLF